MPPSLIFSCSPNRDMNIHANFPKAPACWRQTYSFPSEQSSLYQTLRFFWSCQEESQETLSLSLSDSDFLIFPYSFSNVEVRSNENSSRQGKCCRHSGGSVHPPVADLRAIFTHTIRPTFRTSHHITKMWKVVNPQLQLYSVITTEAYINLGLYLLLLSSKHSEPLIFQNHFAPRVLELSIMN